MGNVHVNGGTVGLAADGNPVGAANPMPIGAAAIAPKATSRFKLAANGVQTLTPPTGASVLVVAARTASWSMTLDGTVPTAGDDLPIVVGAPWTVIPLGTGMTIKAIRDTADSGTLHGFWGS